MMLRHGRSAFPSMWWASGAEVTFPPTKRCFKRPNASFLKRIAARSQRGTSTPFSPPSGASFFVGPSSEAERDASSATCFSA
jgi:hypothetical protein